MGYLETKSVPACLRNHYEKLLFPYDVFQSGLMTATDTPPQVISDVNIPVKHVQYRGANMSFGPLRGHAPKPPSYVGGATPL